MRNLNLVLLALTSLVACTLGCQATVPTRPALPVATAPIPEQAPTMPVRPTPAAQVQEYAVAPGAGPHDVAPAPDGSVWYTAQRAGALGRLDPGTGKTIQIKLGNGSAPHGVIVGPDGAPWVTDGGLNAIIRVDAETLAVQEFPLPPSGAGANLNTAVFDRNRVLWFTGQSGTYGRLDNNRQIQVWKSPKGPGPYGMTTTPDGSVYFASLAGSYLGSIDPSSGAAAVIEPPTAQQGARRVWSDSHGRLWISEWNAGQVGVYDPATGRWREWHLPGEHPQPYAVYVDDRDIVWLSDFANNAIQSFDPTTEAFRIFPLPTAGAYVRQLAGRPGEVWGAESGTDKLFVIRTH